MNPLLPSFDTIRWVARKKAMLVRAIETNVISFSDACILYNISEDELRRWVDLFKNHGQRGLRATRIQEFRGAA